jgi:ABC-2 type transport system permease protein
MNNSFRKYLSLHWAFFRASFAADIEYRLNFFLRIFTDILWYAAQVITFEVLFLQTPMLGSWNAEKVRIFLGILFITDAIYMTFVQGNLDTLSDDVRKGQLDLLLVKPVNSRFIVSCRKVSSAFIVNFFLALTWTIWAIRSYSEPLPLERVFWLFLLIPCGLVIFYSLRFTFSVVSLLTVRADNLQYLWYQIYRLGMRPDTIYTPWMKMIVLTALPVAFVASVPSRALLEEPNYGLFAGAVVAATTCFVLSGKFWKFALTKYSSASS